VQLRWDREPVTKNRFGGPYASGSDIGRGRSGWEEN